MLWSRKTVSVEQPTICCGVMRKEVRKLLEQRFYVLLCLLVPGDECRELVQDLCDVVEQVVYEREN